MVRSPETMAACLDAVMAGLTMLDAAHSVGARSVGVIETWQYRSRQAEQVGDTSSPFYMKWPNDGEADYFHNLIVRARARRGELFATPLLRGTFAIEDGRIVFARDDFGGIALDDNGVPIAQHIAVSKAPLKGRHRPDPDAVFEAMHPRRELKPSSFGGNKPKPVPIYTGSALGDYLAANKPSAPVTPLRAELEAQLADIRANGPKNKPTHPVTILGRTTGDPVEHVSRPSDQSGLPQTAEVSREPAPRPAYARPPKLDGARTPPPGGFRVR
jgi:hypothetical protein